MTVQTEWKVSSGTRVIVHPGDEWDPPRLFVADATYSVTLLPPNGAERCQEFVRFLEDLADGARELATVCQAPAAV
nr:hypothetical protein [Kibdelosporangium sp. MJ126-NF4]CEL21313.1 hypothetical protein [Kibdelosporangium sp. MJ126-NF4]CTQ96120.1 hypothetical protein [Kibdelosporangium sp. MJ126-NF4]